MAGRVRRLPGIRFVAPPPPARRVLPRMDIAGFVGLAEAGPLHTPVAVEDTEELEAVFGRDLLLARDPSTGRDLYTHLGPAVRAFFRNGGRRCYVVRVGDEADTCAFEVPGLLTRDAHGRIEPAMLAARSPGSWADDVQVGAALSGSTHAVLAASSEHELVLEAAAGAVGAGDLIRVTRGSSTVLFAVASAAPDDASPPAGAAGPLLRVAADPASVVRVEETRPAPGATGSVRFVGADGVVREGLAAEVELAASPPAGGDRVRLSVGAARALAPVVGALVRAELDGRELWLRVDDVEAGERGRDEFVIAGACFCVSAGDGQGLLGRGGFAERLSLELSTRRGEGDASRLADLGFVARHPRWVGTLPPDEQRHGRSPEEPVRGSDPALWSESAARRFPLAAALGEDVTCFPLTVEAVPRLFLGPLGPLRPRIARNGLATFGSDLFLDRALRTTRVEAIAAQADHIRYQRRNPRPLVGVHALLGLDEVTLVAVPDAVHPGWSEARAGDDPPLPAPEPTRAPDLTDFFDCAARVLTAPVLDASEPDAAGNLVLSWTPTDTARTRYRVEESGDPTGFRAPRVVYEGSATRVELYGKADGRYLYRARAFAGANSSPWSATIGVSVGPPVGTVVADAGEASGLALLDVHRALLRMCAARGDILAALSLPARYREPEALEHAAELTGSALHPRPGAAAPPAAVPPLDASEARALSHGALYHPWTLASRDDVAALRLIPPDGVVLGVLAARAATRGAWVPPANEPFRGVLALEPPIARARLVALQDARVNVLRREPAGFLCLSEDTLTDDPDLRPINVRRLLALLRRLALLHGPDLVFELNDGALRRALQRRFEALLTELFVLGAFSGARPEEAFQVVTGSPPNTPRSVEQGRLIVELKVAPARPLAFLTVRLVASRDGGIALEAA